MKSQLEITEGKTSAWLSIMPMSVTNYPYELRKLMEKLFPDAGSTRFPYGSWLNEILYNVNNDPENEMKWKRLTMEILMDSILKRWESDNCILVI